MEINHWTIWKIDPLYQWLINDYHLVMTNSSPWKDPPCFIGKLSIFMGHLYHGYVSHNQRLAGIYGCSSPPNLVCHSSWTCLNMFKPSPSSPCHQSQQFSMAINPQKKSQLWKDPPLFMGKSTISMVIFHGYVSHNQRVIPQKSQPFGQVVPDISCAVSCTPSSVGDDLESEWMGSGWGDHQIDVTRFENGALPSGKHTKSYWKWPLIVGYD